MRSTESETPQGPAVLEVNGNPGFKTLEEVTGVDVARTLIELAVSRRGHG